MTFLGGFQDCQVSYSPQIIYPQTPPTSSLGKPWFSQTSSTWSNRALLWMRNPKLAPTCCFLHHSQYCSAKEKVLMEGLIDFYQNSFNAVHGLTFLFKALTVVLFHPADPAIMYVEIPL